MTEATTATPVVPVVLSGGMGTRLWPASRRLWPKQLLALVGENSMIQTTVDRAQQLTGSVDQIIVTNVDHVDAIRDVLAESGYLDSTFMLEPVGRNTAPAVAVAAHEVVRRGNDLMLVLPADHSISDIPAFASALRTATATAEAGYLVTFGITPSSPETGYGYIKVGETILDGAMRVAEFNEKPDADTAADYVSSGEYLWNSGMFLFSASLYLEELLRHAPDIAAASRAAFETAHRTGSTIALGAMEFEQCRADSIDYAVMEKTKHAAVVPTDPGWNDIGSWRSLWEIAQHSHGGNVVIGDVTTVGVTNSYIQGHNKLIAAVGVQNTVIVDTPNALLVAAMDATQDVNVVVAALKESGSAEYDSDGTHSRPWGSFRSVDEGSGFRVLRLDIEPGYGTDSEVHASHAEHWVVVSGEAEVTIRDTSMLVGQGDSVYIAAGDSHRIANNGNEPLEVIAVEIGLQPEDDAADTSHNS